MIKILFIFLLFISCTKEVQMQEEISVSAKPSPGTGIYTLARNVGDNSKGIRTTVGVRNLGRNSDFAAWISFRFGNGIWIQNGYYNNGSIVTEWYYGDLKDIQYIGQASVILNQRNDFFIYNIPGTTYWELGRNGVSTMRFDAGSDYGWVIDVGIEYQSGKGNFPNLNFYPAIEIYQNGQWTEAASGYVSYCGRFGIEGQLQNPTLRKNELNMGGGIGYVLPLTALW